MKNELDFIVAGMCLTAVTAGYSQPVIINQPQTQAVASGATATFTVGASGTAPLAYQWQRNLGAGFADLADCTNAVLVLSNAQTWDATDYRVVVTNLSGARTSAVAHFYVLSPGLLTNQVVLDNFDDYTLTGWVLYGGSFLAETNQHLTLGGYWPGRITYNPPDTIAITYLSRNWTILEGQSLEWRADLVGMNTDATAALLELPCANGAYVFWKGRDFFHLTKYIYASGGPAHFLHESTPLQNTNVVLAFALTRATPNLILTVRILDKANQNAVLYERSVVDTPNVDRTLNETEQQIASGMWLKAVNDIQEPPWTSFIALALDAWQYNYDGNRPAANATFDNAEVWTYHVPIIRYVDAASANPMPPYTNWATAAHVIQDAVDAAAAGDEIVVTNGIYATGGRAVGTNVLVNRVAADKPLTLRSVNGPQFTVIQGYQLPGTTNGDGAIRCVYLAGGATLSGFTLTNGGTGTNWNYSLDESGGGVWCKSEAAVITNCVLAGNSASAPGGGAYGGTLNDCILASNSVSGNGGGAYCATLNSCTLKDNSAGWAGGGACDCTLNNSTLTGNSAGYGGGASDCTLNNCTIRGNSASSGGGVRRCTVNNCVLTGNSAAWSGGGASSFSYTVCYGALNNCTITGNSAPAGGGVFGCTLNNCIVCLNTAVNGANYSGNELCPVALNYCCTTPMPTNGAGNITNAPLFVNYAGGNLRLQSNSPCINAGNNSYLSDSNFTNCFDLDGNPRIVSGTVDIGAYEFQGTGSVISYAWLQQYGLPTDGSADFTDPDADRHNTWQEWRCQTDPTNPLSILRLLSASPNGTPPSEVTVTWQSVAGVTYFLERSTNLASPLTPLASDIVGQPGTTTFPDTNAASLTPLFYRVGVTIP